MESLQMERPLLPFESELQEQWRDRARENQEKELSLNRFLHNKQMAISQEQARHYNLRILFLAEEKDNLQLRIDQRDNELYELSNKAEDLQSDKDAAETSLETEKVKLRAKIRENELQKVELDSLRGVASDSTRVLSDKLSLAREVASLKTEIDHMRSQAASHQSLLSEKLTLERQLKTVQVELETEKKLRERYGEKAHALQSEAETFASLIGKLKSEISQGQLQLEREAQRFNSEWESKNALMESRVDGFRSKLRITKEQLKATQADLRNAQPTTKAGSSHSVTIGLGKEVDRTAYKRTLDANSVIGTPGALPGRKKNDRGSTLPGDKSTFSMTPYLNRARSVSLDDAARGMDNSENEDEITAPHEPLDNQGQVTGQGLASLPKTKRSILDSKSADSAKTRLLKSKQPGKSNSRAPPKRNVKAAPSLEKVTEREEDNEDAVAAAGQASKGGLISTSDDTSNDHGDAKKKRRKLLGGDHAKTLFDDEEDVKGEGALKRPAFGAPKSRSRIALAPSKGSFGTISPLKKDKRAAADQE